MVGSHEGDLAWDLVDHTRQHLTDEESIAVFVDLGVGDYLSAIDCILAVLARENQTLPIEFIARLDAWVESADRKAEYGDLLARIVGDDPIRDLSA